MVQRISERFRTGPTIDDKAIKNRNKYAKVTEEFKLKEKIRRRQKHQKWKNKSLLVKQIGSKYAARSEVDLIGNKGVCEAYNDYINTNISVKTYNSGNMNTILVITTRRFNFIIKLLNKCQQW